MVDITLSDKQMKPAVVHTDQFENGVNVLRFTINDYMQGSTDLRKFKAYAITSLNGVHDITQLPYTVSGRVMTLTWDISAYTLRNPGVIQYQIRFAESAVDGTAVWYSYKCVIINRLSINADDYMSAQYPTLMKQWLDLMQTLSGSFGAEIVYMGVNESIPVEERLNGRLYYQWLEIPSTRATCATGTVNLSKRPYADSGLYINGVHVFVDDTADAAYVLDVETWVNAINAANCGVTATDISTGDEIIIMLTAKKAGTAGNYITLALDLALYGAGANTANPSGGTVSGATLVGGSNEQTGVDYPTGQFEDAHGNILGYSRAKYVANADLNTLLENGEYICAGTMTNNPLNDNTYCIVRVTDSSTTSRVFQECHCVSLADNTVRTFTRALTSSDDTGEWREVITDKVLAARIAPDWTRASEITLPYTASKAGWVVLYGGSSSTRIITVNGIEISHAAGITGTAWIHHLGIQIIVDSGDVIGGDLSGNTYGYFIPCKGD